MTFRYYVNDNQIILVIEKSDHIHIVESFKANEVIMAELFNSWSFMIWFAFRFDYYVEETDDILYWEALKVTLLNEIFYFTEYKFKN